MTFDLPNTDLTGELIGCWTVALQRKGTLQRRLATAPHLREGEFLHQKRKEEERVNISARTNSNQYVPPLLLIVILLLEPLKLIYLVSCH